MPPSCWISDWIPARAPPKPPLKQADCHRRGRPPRPRRHLAPAAVGPWRQAPLAAAAIGAQRWAMPLRLQAPRHHPGHRARRIEGCRICRGWMPETHLFPSDCARSWNRSGQRAQTPTPPLPLTSPCLRDAAPRHCQHPGHGTTAEAAPRLNGLLRPRRPRRQREQSAGVAARREPQQGPRLL